jgi:ketosteroid isomerase-like protein
MSEREHRELLVQFAEAWRQHNVPALLELLTEDAVYAASVGPEPGTTYRGHDEIAAGFVLMFAHDEGGDATQEVAATVGDTAVTKWTYIFEDSGRAQYGVDLWRFRDGKISCKDAYRKAEGPIGPALASAPGSRAHHHARSAP